MADAVSVDRFPNAIRIAKESKGLERLLGILPISFGLLWLYGTYALFLRHFDFKALIAAPLISLLISAALFLFMVSVGTLAIFTGVTAAAGRREVTIDAAAAEVTLTWGFPFKVMTRKHHLSRFRSVLVKWDPSHSPFGSSAAHSIILVGDTKMPIASKGMGSPESAESLAREIASIAGLQMIFEIDGEGTRGQ